MATRTSSRPSLGKRTGARFVVLGLVLEAGRDSARVTAWLVDVATRRRGEPIELRDATDRMDRIADSLTLALLRAIGEVQPVGAVRRASVGSASLPAIRAFLKGEQYLRRTEWDSALAAYARAIALDSNFALAQSHIGLTYGWLRFGPDSLARKHALRAASLNRGLGSRDSMLIVADSLRSVAYAYGGDPQYHAHVARLFATLRRATTRYEQDAETWYRLADAYFHFGIGPGLSVPEAEILQTFDRSISLDSAFAPAYIHPVELGFSVADSARGAPLCTSILRSAPERHQCSGNAAGGAVDGWRERRHARGTPDGRHGIRRSALSGVRGGAPGARSARCRPRVVAGNVPHAPRHPAAAVRSRVRASPARSPTLVPRQVRRGVGTPGDTSERRDWRDGARESLRRAGSTACVRRWLRTDPREDLFRSPLLATAGAWWAQVRDTMSLREMARRAGVAAPRNTADALIAAYSAAVASAYLALARADTVESLRRFAAVPDSLCELCSVPRLVHARLLAATGHPREAAAILADRPTLLPLRDRRALGARARARRRTARRSGHGAPQLHHGRRSVARCGRRSRADSR